MGLESSQHNKGNFYNVAAGAIRKKVDQETEGAKARKYIHPKTKKEEVTYELVYPALSGQLTNAKINKSQIGTQLMLFIEDGDQKFILTMGIKSRYAKDFLKKAMNIDLGRVVRIAPFDFIPKDKTKSKIGLSITHPTDDPANPDKVYSFFWDNKKEKSINGIPEAPKDIDWDDEDERDEFFLKETKFLKNFFEEKFLPQFELLFGEQETKQETQSVDNQEKQPIDNEEDDGMPF